MPNDTLRPFSLPTIGRKKLTEEIEVLFVHILLVALDGTKIHPNASQPWRR